MQIGPVYTTLSGDQFDKCSLRLWYKYWGQTTAHGTETIGWLAIEAGPGECFGHAFLAGKTSNSVTHSWYVVSLTGGSFSAAPRFLAQISTHDGGDPSALRYQSLGSASV